MDDTARPLLQILGVAMALARHLRKTVREPRLGILLPPGKGGMIANYACLLAGIVPVNINYTSSEDSFRSIVRQSGIRHFISAHAFMSKLPQFPCRPTTKSFTSTAPSAASAWPKSPHGSSRQSRPHAPRRHDLQARRPQRRR